MNYGVTKKFTIIEFRVQLYVADVKQSYRDSALAVAKASIVPVSRRII